VYFGGQIGSLRAGAGNLSVDEISEAMDFIHERGRKGYMTLNIYAHNDDIPVLRDYIGKIRDIPVDAFLVSDPGVMGLIKEQIPDAEIHLSTQANTTNYLTAAFWVNQGVKRIVAAREMSLAELAEMRRQLPDDIEIEAFMHGAMCISYSGRCLLSNFMAGRDANRGACTHPCRWKYALVEETRPNQSFPIIQEGNTSYVLSSRDLNCIGLLDELIDAGVTSLKIEGRMKTEYYVAVVVNAYRRVLDGTMTVEEARRELDSVSHRPYTTGFYHGELPQDHSNAGVYTQTHRFAGAVLACENGVATVEQRNRFEKGDTLEVVSPVLRNAVLLADDITDTDGAPVEIANKVKQILRIKTDLPLAPGDLLRIKA
jgi:putative protease